MSISSLSSTSSAWATAQTQRPSGPPPGGGPQKTLSAVAELLGTDSDTLKTQLDSGKTMSELAEAAGVDDDDLIDTIQATLPTQAPDGSAIDTSSMAAAIAGGQGGPPPKPPVDTQSSVDALSSALGVSTDDLLKLLTGSDNTSLVDLLKQNPDVATQLSHTQNKGALVDGYT